MSRDEIKQLILEVAREYAAVGPGYAQEGPVLRAVRDKLRPPSVRQEQQILDCWHELFQDGTIGWGYSLDSPGAPFFHLRERHVSPA